MSTKEFMAVLGCTLKKPQTVIDRGRKLLDNLYVNVGLYATPTIPQTDFEPQWEKANIAQGNVKGSGEGATILRNKEVGLLFKMIKKLLLYVNELYLGNAENLFASGFPLNKMPEPHDIPKQLVIEKVVNGKEDHSAKIMLTKLKDELDTMKEKVTYILQMAVGESKEENFKTVLEISDSRKLVKTGLTRGAEVFFRIAAVNAKGKGMWSDVVPFIPQ